MPYASRVTKRVRWTKLVLPVPGAITIVLAFVEVRDWLFWTLAVVGIACLIAGFIGVVVDSVHRSRTA
jgi:hypothetical protein